MNTLFPRGIALLDTKCGNIMSTLDGTAPTIKADWLRLLRGMSIALGIALRYTNRDP
jgi:hypothetical protein